MKSGTGDEGCGASAAPRRRCARGRAGPASVAGMSETAADDPAATGAGEGRVVLVAHPSADRYGSDRMLLESVRGLVAAQWQVVVTLPAGGELVADLRAAGAQVTLCPTVLLSKAALTPRGAARLLRDLMSGSVRGWTLLRRTRPDVAYVSTVTVPWWIVLAWLRRVPVVAHVHEAERSAARPLRVALGAPLLLARAVAVNSRFAATVLTDSIPALAHRLRLVPNGVVGPPVVQPARERLEGPLRLVYVGRLSERKGVDVAVEALVLLRDRGVDARLDLVGAVFPGYEWYEERLRALVAERDLDAQIVFCGFQDPAWPYLAAADVALVPSRTDEPFGNTAVEAVLAGRPAVVAASGGLVEAAADYRTVRLVAPGDPAALADAVEDLTRTWEATRALIAGDTALAAERHAPQRYRELVASLVADIAGRGR